MTSTSSVTNPPHPDPLPPGEREVAFRPVLKRRARWTSLAALTIFLLLCFGYYRLCPAVGYVMAWTFLAGFAPAAPAAILATRTRRLWLRAAADLLGFAAYFWLSGMLPAWKGYWLGA